MIPNINEKLAACVDKEPVSRELSWRSLRRKSTLNELKRPYREVNLVVRNRAGFRGSEIGDKQRKPTATPWGFFLKAVKTLPIQTRFRDCLRAIEIGRSSSRRVM